MLEIVLWVRITLADVRSVDKRRWLMLLRSYCHLQLDYGASRLWGRASSIELEISAVAAHACFPLAATESQNVRDE